MYIRYAASGRAKAALLQMGDTAVTHMLWALTDACCSMLATDLVICWRGSTWQGGCTARQRPDSEDSLWLVHNLESGFHRDLNSTAQSHQAWLPARLQLA